MLQRKITFYAFIGLLISSILLNVLVPYISLILVLVWLKEGNFTEKWKLLVQRKYISFLPVYYILVALSIGYLNPSFGLRKLEIQLTLIILPLILATLKSLNFSYHKRTFIRIYVAAIYAAFILCFVRAVYFLIQEQFLAKKGMEHEIQGMELFFGSMFSNFLMRPEFLSLHIAVAAIVMMFDFRKLQSKRKLFLKTLSILFLSLFLVMTLMAI